MPASWAVSIVLSVSKVLFLERFWRVPNTFCNTRIAQDTPHCVITSIYLAPIMQFASGAWSSVCHEMTLSTWIWGGCDAEQCVQSLSWAPLMSQQLGQCHCVSHRLPALHEPLWPREERSWEGLGISLWGGMSSLSRFSTVHVLLQRPGTHSKGAGRWGNSQGWSTRTLSPTWYCAWVDDTELSSSFPSAVCPRALPLGAGVTQLCAGQWVDLWATCSS